MKKRMEQSCKTKMFKRLGYMNDKLYEVELVKSEIKKKEPLTGGVFTQQFAKMGMLELYYFFFDKFCDVTKFKELEMDNDSHCLALSEQDLYECIRPAMEKVWNFLRNGDCTDELSANSTTVFIPRIGYAKHNKQDRLEPGPFENDYHCTEKICLGSRAYCCYDSQLNKFKFTDLSLE